MTYDEITDIEEGIRIVNTHEFKEPYNPPFIRQLAALPLTLGLDRIITSSFPHHKAFPARFVIVMLSTLLLIAVYLVSRHFFGSTIALVGLLFLTFNPELLAHSHYVTFDAALTLFFFLAYLAVVKLFQAPTLKLFVMFGVIFGLLLSTKVSGIGYFLISLTLLLLVSSTRKSIMRILKNKKRFVLVGGAVSLLVIWSIFFFQTDVVIQKRQDPNRLSARLKEWARSTNNDVVLSGLYILENQKLPLGTYLAILKNNVLRARERGEVFFLGQWYPGNRWYFMMVNFLLKTPLPLLWLFFFSITTHLGHYKKHTSLVIFVLPVISIFLISSLSNMEPRTRYVLPVVPFMAIIAARALGEVKGNYGKLLVATLVAWYVFGTLREFPHFISYANELAGPRATRYQRFTDSNIDWGQSLPDLSDYAVKTQPKSISFSYFGRDNGDPYGLVSHRPYGSYKFEDICAFHEIPLNPTGQRIIAISIANWYGCGFYQKEEFRKKNIKDVVGESILIY